MNLLELLPPIHEIDRLIEHYFQSCDWIYRHINQRSFSHSWDRVRRGQSFDSVVIATAAAISAVAVCYLPPQHHLLRTFGESSDELRRRFYGVLKTCLHQHAEQSTPHGLDLVELLLIRSHYLTLSKQYSNELWAVKSEVLNIGTAIGLHQDPGKLGVNREEAERRRWAWWNIFLLDRWQAFMFGRPIGIASDHFDTRLPSYCDPEIDHLYLPNIALFRLAYVLGHIVNDAVARRRSCEVLRSNDLALAHWRNSLPAELDMDEYRIARSFRSPDISIRRLGIQSVVIHAAYYHIRFMLHRPYANTSPRAKGQTMVPQSLEIAVCSADKLINLIYQIRTDFLSDALIDVPGHMKWGDILCFTTTIFLCAQLISVPDQPGADMLRGNVRKALVALRHSSSEDAEKALNILQALSPLHSVQFAYSTASQREQTREIVFESVKNLPVPYYGFVTYP